MRNKWIRRILIVVVIVAVVVALRLTVFRPDPVPVTVFRVAPGLVEEVVTNSKAGTVKTRRRAALSTEIGGLVAALPVQEGDRVEQGQVLLRLVDADYRATLALRERAFDTAEFARSEACTNAEQAKRDLARYIRLAEEEVVSQELLDQFQSRRDAAVAGCDGARARVLEADAALEVARVNLAKTVLRAPFAGVVAELSTELGEYITPSPPGLPIPPVIEILDNEAIYVSAPLDEVDVGRVDAGPPVRVTLDAYPGESFPGHVARVAPYVLDLEEQNRTFEIEVEFEDAEFARTLRPGTSADVEVILDAVEGVLRIPSYALIEGRRVLRFNEGVLESVDVETGLQNWQFTEIRSGLTEGDAVVVSLDRVEVQAGAAAEISAEAERLIKLEQVSRTYEIGGSPLHALQSFDLEIPDGAYLAIMGPSGSGKSTLLNIIGCLDRPTSGSYVLDGKEVAKLGEAELSMVRRHRIGFVFQTFHLVPRLSATANVELPMIFAGVERAERRERAAGALAAVDLSDRSGHRPDQLSGGERQRVAIARAVVMGPSILLADEPTGNLDSKSGDEVIQLLERMNRDDGLTLIVVTHDPEIGQRARTRIRLMDGRLAEVIEG